MALLADTPDFLTIGHATRDLLPGGDWRLGGTVTFAALTAERLGLHAAIVTSGPPDVLAALREALPDIAVHAIPSADATTYENIYTNGARRQYLRGRAAPLALDAIPTGWRNAPLVLLAPLANEVDPTLAAAFPHSLVAATPQGWLRRWDATGHVSPGPFVAAQAVLPHLRALILSREDLLAPANEPGQSAATQESVSDIPRTTDEADALLADWARLLPLIAVTQGPAGALLYQGTEAPEHFPGYPAQEVDPTGAGDVFAAAFLCELHQTGDARAAVDFANRVAACSVEQIGGGGIPTRAEVARRFGATG